MRDFSKTKRKDKVGAEIVMILRHRPADIPYTRDGWFDLRTVLDHLKNDGYIFNENDLLAHLEESSRVEIKDGMIRALHGHSVDIEINWPIAKPELPLYHATPSENKESILKSGLQLSRRVIFLSPNIEVAKNAVNRYKKDCIVFEVDIKGLDRAGHNLYLSNDDVWLSRDVIPPDYLKIVHED